MTTKTQAKVWHSIFTKDSLFYRRDSFGFNQSSVVTAMKADQYKMVLDSFVELDPNINISLEELFERTNNISKPWNGTDRSTSVGDVIQIGDRTFVVAATGFDEITEMMR